MNRTVSSPKTTAKPKVSQTDLFVRFDRLAAHHQINLLARRFSRIAAKFPPEVANAALELAMQPVGSAAATESNDTTKP